MGRRIAVLGTLVGMLALGLSPESVNAAFPGTNGKIVFSRLLGSSDQEVFTMNPNGTGVHQLTHGVFNVTWPTWSPQGTRILADGIVDSKVQLFVMNEDGSGLTQLT